MTETRMLVKKLAEVMKAVKYIEKKGYNAFHKYKYATEADVAEKVREELSERNVMMIPSVLSNQTREHVNAKGKTEYIVTVEMEFTFMDGDTGETISFRTVGEGQDAGDKGSYKAMTGAQKYALMKAFMIPTGDDPEADSGTDERNNTHSQQGDKPEVASDKQLNLVKSLLKKKVTEELSFNKLHDHLKTKLGTQNNLENFTKAEASKAISILQGNAS
ncbi:ERF family protein [Priestia flexa]|uniref:ERF family protein n=1 Tax=Priestia flexa TaxID=86664 RepID=UPI001F4C632C|nr:ERF family protein [Priestia flexa]